MGQLDDAVAKLVDLTHDTGPRQPRFSLRRHATAANGKLHAEQFGFMTDRAHRVHTMCARQSGKTEGDDGILMDAGLFRPNSTNVILGLNGPHLRMNNWDPKWTKMFDRYSGLDKDWNYERMATYFPNGARVIFFGADDSKHLKNILGGTIEDGVVIVDECFPAGTPVDGRPIETIAVGDIIPCVDHLTGRLTRRKVVRCFSRETDEKLVRLVLGGRNISCTPGHPVFVRDRGYLHVEDIRIGDLLCVRRAATAGLSEPAPQDMLAAVPGGAAQARSDREHLAHAGRQRQDCGGKAREEPNALAGKPSQDGRNPQADRASAGRTARKRTWTDARRESSRRGTWTALANRRYRSDEAATRVRLSELLQAGCGGRIDQDVYRGRWSLPLDASQESDGREEDGLLEWARVESVTRDEPGSPGGTTVYNLEVEGAHTYFANDVLVHNCQDQQNLDELLDSTLPPMMGLNARLILTGVFPEVPAGRFWRESGWREQGPGNWIQEQSRGWSRHNWGRLANVHMPDSWAVLQRYLKDTGKSINDPDIIRDWMGKPAFDPNATAYRYNALRNGYVGAEPDWLRMAYAAQKDERGRDLKYCHPMRPDKDGILYGMQAALPLLGVKIFALALDPGHASDRASIQGIGFGDGFKGIQHLFDWTTPRKSFVSTGDMYAVLGMVYRAFLRWGEALNPHYDAGSSTNTIDNLQSDYGIPLVLAAKKADKPGQIDRCNDLLTEGKASVMFGSALEQDLTRARYSKQAAERSVKDWDRAHHPDASEAWRYATADYFDAKIPKEPGGAKPYGYQDPIDRARPSVNYNPAPAADENYGGGQAFPERERGGGGDYGGGYGGGFGGP